MSDIGKEPAFPQPYVPGSSHNRHMGMSIREYFIAEAMKGLLSSGQYSDGFNEELAERASRIAYFTIKHMEKRK